MAILRAVIVGALGLASCAGTRAPSAAAATAEQPPAAAHAELEVTDEVYRRVMTRMFEKLEEELLVWSATEFSDKAAASRALMSLLPTAPRASERMGEVLAELSVDREALATYIATHPEAVARIAESLHLEERMDKALTTPRVQAQLERLDALPEGHSQDLLVDMLQTHRLGPAPTLGRGGPLTDWERVRSRGALESAVSAADGSRRPAIVHFTAQWAVPCKELELKVLADATVRARLQEFSRVYVDVTEPNAEEHELQALLTNGTVPKVLVFASGADLVAQLQRGEAPTPQIQVDTYVEPAQLLERMDAARL